MNPLFEEGRELATSFHKLGIVLRGNGRSHIVLAVADDDIVRQEAMTELAERLSGSYAVHGFDFATLDRPTKSLPRFGRSLSANGPVSVFGYGLEELKARRGSEEDYKEALYFLNAHREDIRYSGCTVVLWLTSPVFIDVLQQAGDFADWRRAVVELELPPGCEIERSALGRLSLGEAERLRQKILSYEEMLEEQPRLDPVMRTEFKKRKDIAERRLGRIPDVGRDYRLYLKDELQDVILPVPSDRGDGRPLRVPLSEVFFPLEAFEGRLGGGLSEKLDEPRQHEDYKRRLKDLEAEQASRPVVKLEEILAETRCVLLGDPGSGKTTVAQYVAWSLASSHADHDMDDFVPVFVRLACYALRLLEESGELSLLNYVQHHLHPRRGFGRHLAKAIRDGRGLVVLDGLDGVTDTDLRTEVVRRIEELVALHEGNRFLVTSRVVGYDRAPMADGFRHLTLRGLRSEEQERFVDRWSSAMDSASQNASRVDRGEKLSSILKEKEQLVLIAKRPLLLTFLLAMHRRGHLLPGRRIQVYQGVIDWLLEEWSARLDTRLRVDAEEIKRILVPIARHKLLAPVRGVALREDLDKSFQEGAGRGRDEETARKICRSLLEQGDLFIRCVFGAGDQTFYGFPHSTIVEYLAALDLVQDALSNPRGLREHAPENVWHESLLFTVEQLSAISPKHAKALIDSWLEFPDLYQDLLRYGATSDIDYLASEVLSSL
jgi:hypothetical protein